MISHRVGARYFDIAAGLETPQVEAVPDVTKLGFDLEILEFEPVRRAGPLDETAGTKLHRLLQTENNFTNQGSDIARFLDHAIPGPDVEISLVDLDRHRS